MDYDERFPRLPLVLFVDRIVCTTFQLLSLTNLYCLVYLHWWSRSLSHLGNQFCLHRPDFPFISSCSCNFCFKRTDLSLINGSAYYICIDKPKLLLTSISISHNPIYCRPYMYLTFILWPKLLLQKFSKDLTYCSYVNIKVIITHNLNLPLVQPYIKFSAINRPAMLLILFMNRASGYLWELGKSHAYCLAKLL